MELCAKLAGYRVKRSKKGRTKSAIIFTSSIYTYFAEQEGDVNA